MARYDVLGICNALMDLLVEVEEHEFDSLNIRKGVMHLVDHERQAHLLKHFEHHPLNMELGGSAMNAARALALMGGRVAFFGAVGKDYFGDKILTRMAELSIDSHLMTIDAPTGSCAILITPDGERTMNTCLGASSHYDVEAVPEDAIRNSRILHFTGYQWSTAQQKRAVKHAIACAKKAGSLVSFDVADPFMVQNCRDEFLEVIRDDANIVFANSEECRELYRTDPEEACAQIAEDTGKTAVIKLGAEGALIRQGAQTVHVAPEKTAVIDTTAAGDMFAAGFLHGFLQHKSLAACGKIAAILAADVISRVGAKLSDGAITRARAV